MKATDLGSECDNCPHPLSDHTFRIDAENRRVLFVCVHDEACTCEAGGLPRVPKKR